MCVRALVSQFFLTKEIFLCVEDVTYSSSVEKV